MTILSLYLIVLGTIILVKHLFGSPMQRGFLLNTVIISE
jgi:hypothetical protein